jgi:hypothetical protein
MKVDNFVNNLWVQIQYLRGFADALQHPALGEFITETVDLLDKFEKEWPDERADVAADGGDGEEDGSEQSRGDGGGIIHYPAKENGVC